MPDRISVVRQSHDDQIISMLADQKLRFETDLNVSGTPRGKYSINNLMADLLARFSTRHEFEWSLLCIAQYDPEMKSWSNRFNEQFTFEIPVKLLWNARLHNSCLANAA